jgi:hypothetical protein
MQEVDCFGHGRGLAFADGSGGAFKDWVESGGDIEQPIEPGM